MGLRRSGVLVPCDAVHNFPTHYVGEDAAALLACFTSAWRPGLVAAAGVPQIVSAFDLPDADAWRDGLLIVATPSDSGEVAEWLDQVAAVQGPRRLVVEGFVDRPSIISAIDAAVPDMPPVDAEIEAEFFALAYAYLQVEQLAHDLSFGTVFRQDLFESAVVEAAQAAVAGDAEATQAALRRAYDQLEQSRNHAYPVEVCLVDVMLVAESTLGGRLVQELQPAARPPRTPVNLLLTGALADEMAEQSPDDRQATREAAEQGRACLLAAGYAGDDFSLLAPEAMHDELRRGIAAIHHHFDAEPTVFASRHSSTPPRLPQLLDEFGFRGALLAGFDGLEPPTLDRGRTTWMGIDGTPLEAAVAVPRDLALPETMLRLGERLSETLQHDNTPTLLLAGWPGARHPAYADLLRVTSRSDVLGRFVALDEFFNRSNPPDHWASIASHLLGPRAGRPLPGCRVPPATAERDRLASGLDQLAASVVDAHSTRDQASGEPFPGIRSALSGDDGAGRRQPIEVNAWSFPIPGSAGATAVPPHGYQLIADRPAEAAPPRAEQRLLRNERLEALINPQTGGLQSLRRHGSRQNHASQRLLFTPAAAPRAVAEIRVESLSAEECSAVGVVRSRGLLTRRNGSLLARFEQVFRLPAHADYLVIDTHVEPTEPAAFEASSLVCQFAFAATSTIHRRSVQWCRLPAAGGESVASEYVELGDADAKLTVAADTPLRFRPRGEALLDAILPTADRPVRRRFVVGVNVLHPLEAALGGVAEAVPCDAAPPPGTPNTGWWLHCDAANVLVSRIEPVPGERRVRLRLIETEGRVATCRLRLCRPIRSACRETFLGQQQSELEIVDGAVAVELGPCGWLQLVASW